jgi:hypothetical protein
MHSNDSMKITHKKTVRALIFKESVTKACMLYWDNHHSVNAIQVAVLRSGVGQRSFDYYNNVAV